MVQDAKHNTYDIKISEMVRVALDLSKKETSRSENWQAQPPTVCMLNSVIGRNPITASKKQSPKKHLEGAKA
jgi:hypothetical protein